MGNFNKMIVHLIRLYLIGAITKKEKDELEEWVVKSEDHRRFFEDIRKDKSFTSEYPEFCDIDMEKGWSQFVTATQPIKRRDRSRWWKYAAVIVIPLAVGISVWLINRKDMKESREISEVIQPGERKATLVLSEGMKIPLVEFEKEIIEVDPGMKVRKTHEEIVYEQMDIPEEVVLRYNTLQIPRGGEFNLVLSDGTRVMLNSASDLKYPVLFNKKERRVFLSGEAYFEVAKDSTRPFYVVTDDVQVRVYGTSFDVNTHREKVVQAILVEGKIGIKPIHSGAEQILHPGELARFDRKSGILEICPVDTRQYTAWTKGIFTFEDETLEDIMSTLSLWYDVDVFFQSESVKYLHFSGHLERYKEIRNILDAITEATGVGFSVKGRTIIVSR